MTKNNRTHIASVHVENFRRLTVAEVKFVPAKGLIRVTGQNRAGKTSFIKALAGGLGGAGEVDAGSLHDGADRGRITLHLTNGYTIERRITEANPKGALVVTAPDGGKHGQAKLDSWMGRGSFDPMAFLSLKPSRQRDVLFSIATDPDLPEKLRKVQEAHLELYEERPPIISRRRHLASLTEPAGDRPEPIDTSAEMARLSELQIQDRALGDANREAHDAQHVVLVAEKDSAQRRQDIERLDAQLKEAHTALSEAQAAEVDALEREKKSRHTAEALPDPTEAMEEVSARLQKATDIQAAMEPWRRWDEAQEESQGLTKEHDHLTGRLRELKQREADLLENAGISVKGLSFDEDGDPLLNGHAFKLASGADQIDMAVDVAIAADPDVGVCLIDEAADGLDLDSMKRLHARAVEEDFQVWCCRIGLESSGEIVVADGVATDAEPVAVSA